MRAVLISLLLFCAAPFGVAADIDRPNIVIVLMDNMGFGEPGVYGGGILRGAETPRIDALAREGMQLLNFNVEAQCTPTRAALMTGRYAVRTGNPTVPRHTPVYGLVDWEYTLPELLSDTGYATGIFGKWHLGQTEGRYPTDHGFDYWFGTEHSSDPSHWAEHDGYDPDSHPRAAMPYVLSSRKGEQPKKVRVFGPDQRARMDRDITDEAISYIETMATGDQPFFAYISYTLLHWPVIPHPDFQGRTGNGQWADALAEIDANIGRLLDALSDVGVADNTLFIFTSDDGPDAIPPMVGSSGPWRGTYVTNLEGAIRVPFIARWPGVISEQRVSNEIVHVTDLYSTIAAIVGDDLPQDRVFDGANQLAFFKGESAKSNRDHVIVYVGDEIAAVKWRNWKMHYKQYASGDMFGPVQALPIPHLFDLLKDPKEQHNVMLDNTWVRWPVNELVNKHKNSLAEFPSIQPGTPNPYTPPRNGR